MKQLLKNTINIFNDYRYHSHHKQAANAILKNIETIKGKTNAKYIKQSNEYAVEVLGSIKYAPWLHVYSAMSSTFKEGWIPDNYYGRIIVPSLKGDYGKISDLKPISRVLYKTDMFPDIAYIVNGLIFDKNKKIIQSKNFKDFLFNNSDKVILKVDESSQGKGVYIFTKDTFSLTRVLSLGNGVFQNFIDQHSFFDEFMPSSVATIRLTTIINDNGDSQLRACYLRMGTGSDTHVKSDTHIRVPINMENGELDKIGYLVNWHPVQKHPNTKTKFTEKIIPCFNECVNAALTLHKKMPYARCIGWDMVVDKNNQVIIMEWNGVHNDIKFTEATQGPCFADLDWENLWRR